MAKVSKKWADAGNAVVAEREKTASVTPIGNTRKKVARTGPGALIAEQAAEQTNAATQQMESIVLLDPDLIQFSRLANRHEESFKSVEFAELKESIKAAGKNLQPIKVRRVGEGYELAYGHRRLEACKQLSYKVAALISELTDEELFFEMDRENRQRADLSPYEQGLHFKRALDENIFPSIRKMADALQIDKGAISKAIALAELPKYVIDAFSSVLDLQYRWAKPLRDASEHDSKAVKKRAAAVNELTTKPGAEKILRLLLGEIPKQSDKVELLSRPGQVKVVSQNGVLTIRIEEGVISKSQAKRIVQSVENCIDET